MALLAFAVCAGLVGVPYPVLAPHRWPVPSPAAIDTVAMLGAAGVPVVVSTSVAGQYAATEAGLVDVFSHVPGGTSAGTGIVLGSGGVVVTNNHVVAKAISTVATDVADGRRYSVIVLGRDPGQDIAVIQLVGAADLAVAPVGDSDRLQVGDPVAAIGNAGGRGGEPTVTTGMVTALDRSIVADDDALQQHRHLRGMIEVSASVQPGDSGGALLSTGGVIGMDTAADPRSGYAIPINTVLAVAHRLALAPPQSGGGDPRGDDPEHTSLAARDARVGVAGLPHSPR